jgi:ribonuclease BN (tRNA processing enzyme)
VPNASGLRASILADQTSVEDAGPIARAAGVKMLVLSHLVSPDDPTVTARTHFGGEVIVGRDLREV